MNPFNNVPFNTKNSWVMAIDNSGCEIWLPVDSYDDKIIQKKLKELQWYLDTQPLPDKLLA